jgi:chemotaxis protein MotA
MDLATIIGLALCFGGILLGYSLEGGTVASLMQLSAACIVFGGAIGAATITAPLGLSINLWKIVIKAFFRRSSEIAPIISKFVGFAEKVRREGLLVLEDDANAEPDEFLRNGLQLVIDGNDTELVKDILATNVRYLEERHHQGAAYFQALAGFAPTFGIMGTVMGLVMVLQNLDKPETLGPAVSAAFIATLYGVGGANAIFMPLALKLQAASREEAIAREIMIEGILSIQAGDNPRIVQEKLAAFIPPGMRGKLAGQGEEAAR